MKGKPKELLQDGKEIIKIEPPYRNKRTMLVYIILRALVLAVLIRAAFRQDFESVFLCGLTLILFLMPSIISRTFKVYLPDALEIIILFFIFAAEILGELNSFYVRFHGWDTMLHTTNGFLCAAVGFALVDLLNRDDRFSFKLSPLYLALVAFCFSMTVGVLWEFFEFSGDRFLNLDMQKDYVVSSIHTVELDESRSNKVIHVDDIQDVIIVHSDGSQEALGLGGYLDVGIIDTMKDLFVNFIGAVVFSCIGYVYVKSKGKGKLASALIPQVEPEEQEQKDSQ